MYNLVICLVFNLFGHHSPRAARAVGEKDKSVWWWEMDTRARMERRGEDVRVGRVTVNKVSIRGRKGGKVCHFVPRQRSRESFTLRRANKKIGLAHLKEKEKKASVQGSNCSEHWNGLSILAIALLHLQAQEGKTARTRQSWWFESWKLQVPSAKVGTSLHHQVYWLTVLREALESKFGRTSWKSNSRTLLSGCAFLCSLLSSVFLFIWLHSLLAFTLRLFEHSIRFTGLYFGPFSPDAFTLAKLQMALHREDFQLKGRGTTRKSEEWKSESPCPCQNKGPNHWCFNCSCRCLLLLKGGESKKQLANGERQMATGHTRGSSNSSMQLFHYNLHHFALFSTARALINSNESI